MTTIAVAAGQECADSEQTRSRGRRSLFSFFLRIRKKKTCPTRPIHKRWSLLRTAKQIFRNRNREAEILTEQLELLWIAARTLGNDETGMAAWNEIAATSRHIAEVEVTHDQQDERLRNWAYGITLVIFACAVFWIWLQPHGLFLASFHTSTGTLRSIGLILQLAATVFSIFAVYILVQVEKHLRSLAMPHSLFLCGWLGISLVSMLPSIAASIHQIHFSPTGYFAACCDGLFVAGLIEAVLFVMMIGINLIMLLRANNVTWDSPQQAFIREILGILRGVLPTPSSDCEPMRRAVDRMLKGCRKWWKPKENVIEEFRDLLAKDFPPDPEAARQLADNRWAIFYRLTRDPVSPNPAFCALEALTWKFVRKTSAKYCWGAPLLMQDLAYKMRNAAKCIEVLGRRLSHGVETQWIPQVCKERAAFLRRMQRCVLMPRNDTRSFLSKEFTRILYMAVTHDWGSMSVEEVPQDVPLPWWKHVIATLRMILVISIPPLGAYWLSIEVANATANKVAWTVAIAWSVVSLLVLLDERFSEKLSSITSIINIPGLPKGHSREQAKSQANERAYQDL